MNRAALLLPLALCSCMSDVVPIGAPDATLAPIDYFDGRSHGEGVLHTIAGGKSAVIVDSVGRRDGRGGLVLDQTIRQGSNPPRTRRWMMRPAGPGRFTGTLTDARGPVEVIVRGPHAEIRYVMTNGMQVEQRLALQKDRRTLVNRLSVRKWGVRVARLDETIRKLD